MGSIPPAPPLRSARPRPRGILVEFTFQQPGEFGILTHGSLPVKFRLGVRLVGSEDSLIHRGFLLNPPEFPGTWKTHYGTEQHLLRSLEQHQPPFAGVLLDGRKVIKLEGKTPKTPKGARAPAWLCWPRLSHSLCHCHLQAGFAPDWLRGRIYGGCHGSCFSFWNE